MTISEFDPLLCITKDALQFSTIEPSCGTGSLVRCGVVGATGFIDYLWIIHSETNFPQQIFLFIYHRYTGLKYRINGLPMKYQRKPEI
ncbi:MAG: hypothetical protein AEth_01891 [Candidatus Argoarchaeum ethanivorans]|uniref:Uncharacterized protein n=1 Tax=Candidatus Argoarchaeum ethanivorans TaxID=2608793 RepID=A0A8B3S0I3_9EURY|nr:MAG: hypothetical protein AEth_01891 [Candidatus Argoarchaeum ethanivorans]